MEWRQRTEYIWGGVGRSNGMEWGGVMWWSGEE